MSMDAYAEVIEALATRISNQRAEIERLMADCHDKEKWLNEWRARVVRAETEVTGLTAELGKAQAEIERLRAEIRELRESDGGM
jgi:chromosome segregation ATPase